RQGGGHRRSRREGNEMDAEDEAEGRREVHLARAGRGRWVEGSRGDLRLCREGLAMTTATLRVARQGVLRHSAWDALVVSLAAAHGALLLAAPSLAVVAVGLWWNSNTIAHNFIHWPFFRGRVLNVLFALYLSALLGVPQSLWRDRHLAHHAGVA